MVIGDYWIQSDAPGHRVFALDVRDLTNVRMVSSVAFDRTDWPHGATGTAVPHGTVFGW